MNLIIKIENPKEDRNTPDDIQMLKEILKRSGVTMRAEDSFGSKSVYRLRGKEEKIPGVQMLGFRDFFSDFFRKKIFLHSRKI